MMQIDGGEVVKLAGRVALAGTAGINGGVVSNFHGHGQQLRRAPAAAAVQETEGKRARVSAVCIRKRVGARDERMGGCGVAAMSDLDGGSGGGVHGLLAVPRWNWSEGEGVRMVCSVQRGLGVVL